MLNTVCADSCCVAETELSPFQSSAILALLGISYFIIRSCWCCMTFCSFCKRVGELLCLSEEGVLLIALNSHKHFRRFAGQLELCCITSVGAVPVMEK